MEFGDSTVIEITKKGKNLTLVIEIDKSKEVITFVFENVTNDNVLLDYWKKVHFTKDGALTFPKNKDAKWNTLSWLTINDDVANPNVRLTFITSDTLEFNFKSYSSKSVKQ